MGHGLVKEISFTDDLSLDVLNSNVQYATLSSRLWGIDWKKYFPIELDNGQFYIVHGDFFRFEKSINKVLSFKASMENNGDPFLSEDFSVEKRKYYQELSDTFLICEKDRIIPIGMFIGTVFDWSTFYARYTYLLPEYRGSKIYQRFFSSLLDVLKQHNVSRVMADVAPHNTRSLHVLFKLGFNISGTVLSERWGALVQSTCFLKNENKSIFNQQFCQNF